jgi:hypothetical protein
MPRPKRVQTRKNKVPRGVTVIWEYCPDVKRQAAALLAFLGVDSVGISTKAVPSGGAPESGAQTERGDAL